MRKQRSIKAAQSRKGHIASPGRYYCKDQDGRLYLLYVAAGEQAIGSAVLTTK